MSNPKPAELSETELDNVTGGCNPYYQPQYWQPKKVEYCAPKKECHPKQECEQPYYPPVIERPV